MATIDVTLFNGEYDLFEIRYNILKPYVDQFIVCEAKTTFSGKPKQLYFPKGKYPDVKYFVINEHYTDKEIKQAEQSPNTQGAAHWKHEFLQKESIKKALTHLEDDDIVFISDTDEIWESGTQPPEEYKGSNYVHNTGKLKLRVYTYYLNNRSSEEFYGTLVGKYRYIKNECLNHLRSNSQTRTMNYSGWHFTSMAHDLRRKLTDSYTKETYANDTVMNHLEENVRQNRDFLGRDFTYTEDESDWPPWLTDHRQDFIHLLK